MRVLASVLAVVLVGCSAGTVPLDSDGGGTAPGTCSPPLVDPARDTIPTAAVRIAGTRADAMIGQGFTCCPNAAAGSYTCGLTDRFTSARFELALATLPAGAAPSPGAINATFRVTRVAAAGRADTSAWGGDLRLANLQTTGTALTLDASGNACSAAGSALFVSATLAFVDASNAACR